MIFSPKQNKIDNGNLKLTYNGYEISKLENVRYLGLIIDNKLNWRMHIERVRVTLTKFVGIFYKIRNKIPPANLKQLYYATVFPQLQYGIEIYANTYKTYLTDLRILNNKILRILQFKPMDTAVKDLYIAYKTVDIEDLYVYKVGQLLHKFVYSKNLLPNVFKNFITLNSDIHSHVTRQHDNMHATVHNSPGSRLINQKAVIVWNTLPTQLKVISNFTVFRKQLLEHLQSKHR